MVTEIATSKTSYLEAFRSVQEREPAAQAWLGRLRENAMSRFEELGFPSTKDEEWKYTNVAAIARTQFIPWQQTTETGGSDSVELAAFSAAEARDSQLVFVNGRLRDDLSSLTALPEEVVGIDLSRALDDERYSEIVWTHLAQHADHAANGFVALNT